MAFEDAWWLDWFSKDEQWSKGEPRGLVREVRERVTDEAVCDVLHELEANGCKADHSKVLNLLRHWARIELSERQTSHFADDRAKSDRAAAQKLQKLLAELNALLRAEAAGIAYRLSQHLDHPLRVHRTYALLQALSETTSELEPASYG